MLNIKNRVGILRIAGVAVVGGGLAIAAAGVSTAAAQYTVPLHQATPITAAGFSSHEAQCASIPSTQDGWAFVLPGNDTVFVSLTVTFNPGGTQTITTFGPPSDKHAYVASAPGAVLESASASVETQAGKTQVPWFNLSHTCPAASPQPSGSPTATPSGSPSTTPSGSPTPTLSGSPTPAPSGSPTSTPGGSPSPTGTAPSAASPSPSPSPSAPPAPAPTPVPGNLPVTG